MVHSWWWPLKVIFWHSWRLLLACSTISITSSRTMLAAGYLAYRTVWAYCMYFYWLSVLGLWWSVLCQGRFWLASCLGLREVGVTTVWCLWFFGESESSDIPAQLGFRRVLVLHGLLMQFIRRLALVYCLMIALQFHRGWRVLRKHVSSPVIELPDTLCLSSKWIHLIALPILTLVWQITCYSVYKVHFRDDQFALLWVWSAFGRGWLFHHHFKTLIELAPKNE